MASKEIDMNPALKLVRKYNTNMYAMYVDYPHKSVWTENFKESDYKESMKHLFSNDKKIPLMLYVHIPYCPKQCLFCICYNIVTRDYEIIKNYLNLLCKEIDLLRKFFDDISVNPNFAEIHLGGGSPSHLQTNEFDILMDKIRSLVNLKQLKEFTIEIDPREVTKEKLLYYHSKGINRISLGIQDFDPEVQKAINRIQPPELIEILLTPDIRNLFNKGINFDILCGLPRQTRESFKKTIDTVIKFSPDRMCNIYLSYAPEYRKHQKLMKKSEIPDVYQRTILFQDSVQNLINSGYVRIGFDHFAKPSDELAISLLEKKPIHWNGLGYRPGEFIDIIGIGASSSSRLTEKYYSQNFYEIPPYASAINAGKLPVYRGHKLTFDDIIRRDIIHTFRNYFFIDSSQIEKKYNINFNEYFRDEKKMMGELIADGIVEIADKIIKITEMGKLFTYNVCHIFDKYNRGCKII